LGAAHSPHFAPAQPAVRTRSVAAWPVWLGLTLALAGAVGGGVRIRVARRRALSATVRASPTA
jgi:hypothetical protein